MGWGYFIDATLILPAASWEAISTQKTDAFPTPVGWWGMKDRELERRFIDMFGDASKGLTFAKLVKRFAGKSSIGRVTPRDDGAVAVRIATLLDKDMDTDIARGVAALFEAAKNLGGEGHASLANDGTYVGEDGVTVTLAEGHLTRKPLEGRAAYTEELSSQLYGDLEALARRYGVLQYLDGPLPPKRAPRKKTAPTKKPLPKKKAAPKKAAPTKKAPRKKTPAPKKKAAPRTRAR